MNTKHWNRLKPIVLAAMDLPEEEQEPFVEKLCANDRALKEAVMELLQTPSEESLPKTPLIYHFQAVF